MKTTAITFIALVLLNIFALVSEPFLGLFKNPNVWLLLGIDLLLVTVYWIRRIIRDMKNVVKRDFKIMLLSPELHN